MVYIFSPKPTLARFGLEIITRAETSIAQCLEWCLAQKRHSHICWMKNECTNGGSPTPSMAPFVFSWSIQSHSWEEQVSYFRVSFFLVYIDGITFRGLSYKNHLASYPAWASALSSPSSTLSESCVYQNPSYDSLRTSKLLSGESSQVFFLLKDNVFSVVSGLQFLLFLYLQARL